jgi:hypothetical protein
MQKIFIHKSFNYLVWTPLGSIVNLYRNIFAFQFTLRSQQPDICQIFATGVIDTGGKFAAGVGDTGGAPVLANISANFRKNSKRS